MFIWEKGTLNKKQEDAIYEDNSVLLIACPGSGKTRTLIYKIAYELSRIKSKKEFIVAITYTNIAADEIKERVELLGVDISQLWIGTIHAFCIEWILRPYSLYLEELKDGFRIISSHDSEEIISGLCKPYKSSKISYWDCGYIATSAGYQLTLGDLRKKSIVESILNSYHEILKENKQIDFEQILFFSYELLKRKPIINSILSKLFPLILIDEFQDTKEIQYHIVTSILKANKGKSRILMVGDPNQSIFENLGGFPMEKKDIESLLGFPLANYSLSDNYRSSLKIISYFESYKTHSNPIHPAGKYMDYQSIITFNNSVTRENLIEELARLILFNINEKGISENQICIVAPQWVHIASITRNLITRLPDLSFNGPGMAPFARDIDNFWYKLSRIILTEPSPNLYIRRLRWSKEVLYELETVGVNISNITNKEFLRICNSIDFEEEDGLAYLHLYFNELLNYLNIKLKAFPMLKEHYNSFFSSSEKRIARLIKEGNPFIGRIDNFNKVFKQKKGIKVSTIHGVKGEEYDTMIGFALLDGYVPHFNDKNGKVNSKRLLYVLSSRARKNLHIISERGRKKRFGPPYDTTPELKSNPYKYDEI